MRFAPIKWNHLQILAVLDQNFRIKCLNLVKKQVCLIYEKKKLLLICANQVNPFDVSEGNNLFILFDIVK